MGRSWWMDKRHRAHCYSSSRADCTFSSLVDLPEISGFYDVEVGRATKQINRIFQGLVDRRPPDLELSAIIVEGRPLLAWTQPSRGGPDEDGTIGPDHDPDTIRRALRLKSEIWGTGVPWPLPHKRSYILVSPPPHVYCYASPIDNCFPKGCPLNPGQVDAAGTSNSTNVRLTRQKP
jgi:hypothetical protein